MRSRRLPGSREVGRPAPEIRPLASPLFDGEITIRRSPAAPASEFPAPPVRALSGIVGARSLLVGAVFLQVGIALWQSRRMMLALEHLSLHPGNLLPLAAIGAVATGLLGWAWWVRRLGLAIAFCVTAALWWALFIGQTL